MQNAMHAINEAHVLEQIPVMEMGIGISSGEVVIGNIGSEKRAKYGIVGTPANLAARIESLSTGQQVLISSETVQRCAAALRIDNTFEISVKGAPHPLRISDVTAIGGTYSVAFTPLLVEMSPVRHGVQVDLAVLDGKSLSDTRISAALLACSVHRARIRPDVPLPRYSDVRICGIRTDSEERVSEVYAKVVAQADGDYVLRFTSMFSTDAENFLNGLLQRSTTAP
jgi:adenylate cyclase